MSAVFSTPEGTTVTYLSSIWPWSLHASSRNMTFWNDLLSTLAQLSLFSSSTVASSSGVTTSVDYFVSTTIVPTTTDSTVTSVAFRYALLKSHGDASDNLKKSVNQKVSRNVNTTTVMIKDVKMLNVTRNVPSVNETLMLGTNYYSSSSTSSGGSNNFTPSSLLNNFVDCNDFTEQKLLNIVICSISDVNINLINGSNAIENNIFNETFRNISDDDSIRLHNNDSYYYNGTEIAGNDTAGSNTTDFESTAYFIQVVTTAVVLGIIILATVIGEFNISFFSLFFLLFLGCFFSIKLH